MKIEITAALKKWETVLEGVFTLADLRILFSNGSQATLYRIVAELISNGELVKVKRGFYAKPTATLTTIAIRIEPNSYLSTGTILASKAAIGSIPAHVVQMVKVGRPRQYQCDMGTIEFLSIEPKLFFGFNRVEGIPCANLEKAFLDTCYYAYKGKRFAFDPYSDINLESMNQKTIEQYLDNYDIRFQTYFKKMWE